MKFYKILVTLIILIILILGTNPVFASDKNIWELAKEWLEIGRHGKLNTDPDTTGLQEIAGLLLGIGIFVAFIVGIILGIQFLVSAPEGKAQVLKLLVPYLIGTALIVGALTIWKLAITILDI